jgi:hypothetical protein
MKLTSNKPKTNLPDNSLSFEDRADLKDLNCRVDAISDMIDGIVHKLRIHFESVNNPTNVITDCTTK